MLKSKNAISPILATLLLIVIAVAAIVVTYAWIMTYMSGAGEQAGVMLDVENVSWDSAANTTTIVVKNTGTSDAKIVRVYMGTTKENLLNLTSYSDIGTGKTLVAQGGTATIVIDWPNNLGTIWESNKYYHFNVVPEIGTPKEFSRKSPVS
jgi:flagellin-like protein